jgi:hypothetical protein
MSQQVQGLNINNNTRTGEAASGLQGGVRKGRERRMTMKIGTPVKEVAKATVPLREEAMVKEEDTTKSTKNKL